jgi:hypothetical protein
MKTKTSATLDVFYYQMVEGKISKRKLEDEIYRFFLNDGRMLKRTKKNADEFRDFLCSIYPRISGAIDKYTDKGSSFEAYIAVVILCSNKEYVFKEHKRKIFEDLCFLDSGKEMLVAETEKYNAMYDERGEKRTINTAAFKELHSNSKNG